ncbi:integral membrane sensor signal transduction histidine kinase [Chthoniobacter flavus Ellin428]|uniref:histidine kinase n=1 Tax=Chthoniobacter flavus Ellin428 TaxID=497964 RepID=B4D410_9BACT|nr:sensor histidine kinase [Chthoniobacter flavus]EDY18990.1 integral membrane sensor signal transduction histidine kinase [Chthoniobacter flavus Ellin428]TCO93571.1 signal transduction histidine kinase [Chthoniobacter flavus]
MPFSPLKPTAAQWGAIAVAALGFAYVLMGLEDDRTGRRPVPDSHGTTLEYLEGSEEKLTIDDVAALPQSRWHPWSIAGFAPATKPKNVLWARVRLRNAEARQLEGVLTDGEHYVDRADCYFHAPGEEGVWRQMRSGEWTPAVQKAIWGRETAFSIIVPARGEQAVYLRYEDFFAVWLEVVWWPQDTLFHAMQLRQTLAEGLYFGTLLALLFYNAILWIKLRLPPTGSYLLYLGSFTLFMFFCRSVPQWFGWAVGSPWVESFLNTFLSASAVFLLSFAGLLLDLPRYLPRTAVWLRRLRALLIVLAAASLVAPWARLTSMLVIPGLLVVVAHVAVFGAAVAARRVGAPQASYFMLAIGALFAGVAPAFFYWIGSVPLPDAGRVVMAGSAMEMLLLAVLISERIGFIQQEKIAAQKALLVEAEQREIMQEAYADDLALEVRERTADLERASADKDRILTVLGHDLRSPLTGLTRSAEHLAGRANGDESMRTFLTEAVQTGRGLLLLIEDLVMWARLRAGTGQVTVHPLGAVAAPVFALQSFQAAASGIVMEIQVPDELMVKTDLVPTQALLRNLLSNALKAARYKVWVEATHLPEGVRVAVRDDGQGLPASLEAALIAANPERLPSMGGLGLRLCLEISRALDLKLGVVPIDGGGTEFRFILPTATS